MRQKFLPVGLLATILIVPILVLTGLMLASHDARTPPPAITGLTATDASHIRPGQIDLAWNPSGARDFAYYNIYASLTEITDVTELSPIGRINDRADVTYRATSFAVPGLSWAWYAFLKNTEYWFVVTTVDKAGNESEAGTSASAAIEIMPPLPPELSVLIAMTDDGPQPATVTVPVGTTVAWTNLSQEEGLECYTIAKPHTVTSDTGLFHFELEDWYTIFTYTFTEAGVFGYHCELYTREMPGKVIVE